MMMVDDDYTIMMMMMIDDDYTIMMMIITIHNHYEHQWIGLSETCETSQAPAPAGPAPMLQVRLWHRARGQPHQDSPGDRDHVARPDLGTGEKRRVVQF